MWRRVRPGRDNSDSHPGHAHAACDVGAQRDDHRNVDRHACRRRGAGVRESRVRDRRRLGAVDAAPLRIPEQHTLFVEVKAAGYLDRRVYITWDRAGRSNLAIDMIRDAAPFSLAFYRKLIRNDHDAPGQLQMDPPVDDRAKLLHQHVQPPDRARHPAERAGFDGAHDSNRGAAGDGGRYQAGTIESGSGDRPLQADFINVEITYEPDGDYCGKANVGANPGRIWINYDRCASECGAERISPRTLTHEVGHAMGFWHHDQGGIMDSRRPSRSSCGETEFLRDRAVPRVGALLASGRQHGCRLGPADERLADRRVSRADRHLPPLTPPAPPAWPWPGAWCTAATPARRCSTRRTSRSPRRSGR